MIEIIQSRAWSLEVKWILRRQRDLSRSSAERFSPCVSSLVTHSWSPGGLGLITIPCQCQSWLAVSLGAADEDFVKPFQCVLHFYEMVSRVRLQEEKRKRFRKTKRIIFTAWRERERHCTPWGSHVVGISRDQCNQAAGGTKWERGPIGNCFCWGCKESDTTERLNWTELRVEYISKKY